MIDIHPLISFSVIILIPPKLTGNSVKGINENRIEQDAQLSQRDRAAGWCASFGQKWKTGTGRQYFKDIIVLSSTTVT